MDIAAKKCFTYLRARGSFFLRMTSYHKKLQLSEAKEKFVCLFVCLSELVGWLVGNGWLVGWLDGLVVSW